MNKFKVLGLLALGTAATACSPVGPDKSFDRGINSHDLSTMVAGVWVDPEGCDHWIIDDGVEGYLSERLQPDGTPVCSGVAAPTTVVGPFKSGSPIPDPL
ncbi:lipoprotein, putative [Oceanicola granulosus HTCC2516]|uniref:Lipoprotein, putative n=1 Tax=Oceanicola granulosus (strain ATCC BAA-861 / DSM 15982 / KCTC 12143 / HTCC2516) TaxID=314256 RepID=Q2CE40_OCEGH|nr:hypothetical protein [Oceanicola granulosus]EAR50898.1 lipoprotein, putative [Oceanicola granulosus HTCC2516]